MKLWTIQKPDVLDILERTGIYTADTAKVLSDRLLAPEVPIEEDYTLVAYRWMTRQMITRVGPPPPSVEFPIWAWWQYNGEKHPSPDLRTSGHGNKGTELVRIELDVDRSRVLLSDFDLWFWPYGGHFLPHPKGADVVFRRALRDAGLEEYGKMPLPRHLQTMKEASWEAVLDLGCCRRSLTRPTGGKAVQGTLWGIEMGMVRDVRRFRCR